MNATQSETPFGSKVRKGMFRTVSQLYKVSGRKPFFFLPSVVVFVCLFVFLLLFVTFIDGCFCFEGTTQQTDGGPA